MSFVWYVPDWSWKNYVDLFNVQKRVILSINKKALTDGNIKTLQYTYPLFLSNHAI